MKNKHLIVVGDGVGMYTDYFWSEIYSNPNFTVFNEFFEESNSIFSKINRIHLSLPLNKQFSLPFKGIWDRFSNLANFKFEEDVEYFVLLSTVSLHRVNPKFINFLKRKHNLKLICLSIDIFHYLDRMDGQVGRNYKQIDFDLRLNISKEQAEEFGETWIFNPYSKLAVNSSSVAKSVNSEFEQTEESRPLLYFIGADGTYRSKLLLKLNEFIKNNNFAKFFLIVKNHDGDSMNKELVKQIKEITDSSEYIPPIDNIKNVLDSDVLVEILRYKTSYPTLRYFEAVVYNKKLLTTNQDVDKMQFYNPEFIRIIKDESDFNSELLAWINNKKPVDFGYNNEYSPENFFKVVVEEIKEKS